MNESEIRQLLLQSRLTFSTSFLEQTTNNSKLYKDHHIAMFNDTCVHCYSTFIKTITSQCSMICVCIVIEHLCFYKLRLTLCHMTIHFFVLFVWYLTQTGHFGTSSQEWKVTYEVVHSKVSEQQNKAYILVTCSGVVVPGCGRAAPRYFYFLWKEPGRCPGPPKQAVH